VIGRGGLKVTTVMPDKPTKQPEQEKNKDKKSAVAVADDLGAVDQTGRGGSGDGDRGGNVDGQLADPAAASATGTPDAPTPPASPTPGSAPADPAPAREEADERTSRHAGEQGRMDGPARRPTIARSESEPLGLGDSEIGDDSRGKPMPSDPYDGDMKVIMEEIAAGKIDHALELAIAWRTRAPGDVLALVGLGEALHAKGDKARAARAYGSIIDLFPSRTDLRRMAGERLEELGAEGEALALDTYEKAVAQRPDHPISHRLYAYALLRAGRHEEAFNAIIAGIDRKYPEGRFAQVQRILREDLGLIAAVWLAADPTREPTIARAVGERHTSIDSRASIRFVLNWETDANDVDLHVFDGKGNHAFFRNKTLRSGGELYADVTTGYGPECLTIPGKAAAFPYSVQAHYYGRGPMGYGMGKLEVIEHDGAGHLTFIEQAFVLMKDSAYIDLVKLEDRPSQTKAVAERRGRIK